MKETRKQMSGTWGDPGAAPGWDRGASDQEPQTAADRSRLVRAIAEDLARLEGMASAASQIRSGTAPTSVRRETAEALLKAFPELYVSLVETAMPTLVDALRRKRLDMRSVLDTADSADRIDGGVG